MITSWWSHWIDDSFQRYWWFGHSETRSSGSSWTSVDSLWTLQANWYWSTTWCPHVRSTRLWKGKFPIFHDSPSMTSFSDNVGKGCCSSYNSIIYSRCWIRICSKVSWRRSKNGQRRLPIGQRNVFQLTLWLVQIDMNKMDGHFAVGPISILENERSWCPNLNWHFGSFNSGFLNR